MGSYGDGSGDSADSGLGGSNDSSTGDNTGGSADSGSGAGGGGFSGGWGWGAGSGGDPGVDLTQSSDSSAGPGGGGGGFSGGGPSGDFSGGGGGGGPDLTQSSDSSGVGGGGPGDAGAGGGGGGGGGLGGAGDTSTGGGGGLAGDTSVSGSGLGGAGTGGVDLTASSDSSKIGGGGDTSAVSGAAIGGSGGPGPTTVGFSGAAGDPLSVLDASNDPLAIFDDTNQTLTPSQPAPSDAAAAVDPEAAAYGLDQTQQQPAEAAKFNLPPSAGTVGSQMWTPTAEGGAVPGAAPLPVPDPRYQSDPSQYLAATRYNNLLNADASLIKPLINEIGAEVGSSKTPSIADQAFLEETLNRTQSALMGNRPGDTSSLQELTPSDVFRAEAFNPAYFPSATQKAASSPSDPGYNEDLSFYNASRQALSGSNLIQGGTGNASGNVGVGTETFRLNDVNAGGSRNPERFGVENSDTSFGNLISGMNSSVSNPLSNASNFSGSTPGAGSGLSGINLGDPGSPIPSEGLDAGGPDLSELAANIPATESVSPLDVGVVSNPTTSEAATQTLPAGGTTGLSSISATETLPAAGQTPWVSPGSLGDQWNLPDAQVFRSPAPQNTGITTDAATETMPASAQTGWVDPGSLGDQWSLPEAQNFRSPVAATETLPAAAQTPWVSPGVDGSQWNVPEAQLFRVPDNNAQNIADQAQAERANAKFSSLPLYSNSEWDTINQGNQSATLDDILNPGNHSPLYPGANINSPALASLEATLGPPSTSSIVPPTLAGTQRYPFDLSGSPLNLNLALPQQGSPVQTTTILGGGSEPGMPGTPSSPYQGNPALQGLKEVPPGTANTGLQPPATTETPSTVPPDTFPGTAQGPSGNQPGAAIASNPNFSPSSTDPQIASLEARALGGGFDSLGSLPHNQAQQLSQALVDRLEQNSPPAVQQAISQLSNMQMQEVANDALGQLNQWRQVFLERGIPNPEGNPGWGQVLTQVQARVSQDILSLTGRQASQATISQVMQQA